MSRFQVIEGKLSPLYNHFEDYTFTDCIATDTRLMGAVAMCLRFCADDGSGKVLHVLLHLDYSEYGVDEYLEYFHDTEDEAFGDAALWKDWTQIYGGLGGELQEIPLDTAVYFIEQADAVSRARFRDPDEEIASFQTFARTKMSQFLASLPGAPADGPEHFGRLCKAPLSVKETAHYFIMRLADLDFAAAEWLSDLPVTVLRNSAICRNGIQTLMKDTLSQDGLSSVWRTRTLTMDDLQYYFYTATLRIRFDAKRRRHVIQEFSVDSAQRITEFEAALQLRHCEYISVFAIDEAAESFDITRSALASQALASDVPAGTLRVLYNSHNKHVDAETYFLDRDMYGAYLTTTEGELVLVSNEVDNITRMEFDLVPAFRQSALRLKGRYKFETQVFQTFAFESGLLFEDMIDSDDSGE